MDHYRITILSSLLILTLCQIANGQLFTKYSVKTQMSTSTKTFLTSTICASLKQTPMPVCRRRGPMLWIQDSSYWAPDQQYNIQPTNTLPVEPTAVESFKIDQNPQLQEYPYFHLGSSYAVQPSLFTPLSSDFQWRSVFGRADYGANDYEIGERQLTNLVTIITLTYTKPTTETETTTKTQTIVIVGCTTTPFPYDVCA